MGAIKYFDISAIY